MKVLINKRFLKDLARLPHAERSRVEKFVFQDILKIESIEGHGAFERLKGYHAYYRARFGDYRVGVKFEEGFAGPQTSSKQKSTAIARSTFSL